MHNRRGLSCLNELILHRHVVLRLDLAVEPRQLADGVLLGLLGSRMSSAQDKDNLKGGKILQRTELKGAPGWEAILVQRILPPGAGSGKHTQSGNEIVYIQEGSVTFEAQGKPAVTLKPGEAMLSFYFGQKGSFVWAVPKQGPIRFTRVALSARELDAKVSKLREALEGLNRSRTVERQLTELSMGMSHDYEIAVEEGATLVRVGTAIFGNRTV